MKGNSDKDNFREIHSSVTAVGGRKWMYALKPEGKWYNYRSYISYFYLILFFTLPFISVGGHPLFQFNILKGEFYFFSVLFTPQDFVMFGLGMLIFIFIVIVFTMILEGYFAGGFVLRQFSWRWYLEKLNIGLKEMEIDKSKWS